jgi:hypothetical protein
VSLFCVVITFFLYKVSPGITKEYHQVSPPGITKVSPGYHQGITRYHQGITRVSPGVSPESPEYHLWIPESLGSTSLTQNVTLVTHITIVLMFSVVRL